MFPVRAQGMQFMDDAIWALLEKEIVSPHEAFMKAIDKSRFRPFLSAEEEALGNAAGSVRTTRKSCRRFCETVDSPRTGAKDLR